ncbi:N-acetylmuramoyl-L-alanine amidase [Thermanaeromonas toyohensis ToBE]|uniref:N-acetylmuramoyl-L-alanine amidase n=1 Tax=Thermanaeromonas toyohensis ToBE TaxID=698762 RepID=A0A1W1VWH2_9FIRM|nr:N-acetylmuramoyl-L-alanine amidase [Thermanaeromonas toyohensis]SMB97715.1 N-acetylmuramoyl-L-alanine amidase [Thermanaeromonas toyohensis ToBE]
MPRIGLDAGHGGSDPGAIGPNGLREKDVVLAIARDLAYRLQNSGFEVVMTRDADTDVELEERAARLNKAQADLVLSLHINSASSPSANYVSTWIWKRGGRAEVAAQYIQQALVNTLGWPDGGIRKANFYILRETIAPAVLAEIGFISNPAQADALAQEQTRKSISLALLIGLKRYFAKNDITGHWAEEAIKEILDLGFMHGYPDGSFRPDQPATRAELAAALLNLYQKLKG